MPPSFMEMKVGKTLETHLCLTVSLITVSIMYVWYFIKLAFNTWTIDASYSKAYVFLSQP